MNAACQQPNPAAWAGHAASLSSKHIIIIIILNSGVEFAPLKNKVTYSPGLASSSSLALLRLYCLFVWQKPLSELRNVCHDLWFLHFPYPE